jgi:PAS domain S-box-containing protein
MGAQAQGLVPAERGVYRHGIATQRRPVFRRLDDVVDAIQRLPLPVFALDRSGIIEWLNEAAVDLVGDQCGTHFMTIVAPESRSRVQDEFAKKLLGTAKASEYEAYLVRPDGTHVEVEISSVPVSNHGKIVGVFGTARIEGRSHPASVPHHRLTPRQAQVLRLLAMGRSTEQIAAELGVARETARNHIRAVLRAFDVHSRLEAVVAAMREGLL